MEHPLVRQAAEKFAPRLALAFLRAVNAAKATIDLDELTKALFQGPDAILRYLDLTNRLLEAAEGKGLQPNWYSLKEALGDVYRAGAEASIQELESVPIEKAAKKQPPKTVGMQMRFDLMNPGTVRFVQNYTFNLIRQVSDESRDAIKDIVLRAQTIGETPAAQARKVRGVIGLTRRQTQAVTNYMQNLTGGPPELRETLTRALRDRRFDSTIQAAIDSQSFLDSDQIQRIADRYYEKFLAYRSEMIARTESIRAATMGQQDAWQQAVDQQQINSNRAHQIWLVAEDERLCEACQQVPDMNPDGVPIGGMFDTPEGPVTGPPLHPNCRCTTALEFGPPEER